MDICSRAIDEIITGAREFSEHNTCFRRFIDRMVIPGMILQLEDGNNHSWCLGPGLCLIPAPRTNAKGRRKFPDSILVRQFGVLKHSTVTDSASSDPQRTKSSKAHQSGPAVTTSTESVWLELPGQSGVSTSVSALTRHSLRSAVTQFHVGDRVVGVVTRKAGDYYMVDIGCSSLASLGYLSFEGASKKNRPDLNPGDVVYAMITQADRDLEVELSCVDESGRASGMGILGRHEPGTVGNAGGMAGGVMLHCTPELVRRLGNAEQFPLLNLLAKKFPFEVCLGANGRIWLTARSPRETMLLANVISLADHIPADQCCAFSRGLIPG